jgi:hypothetical protein
VVRANDANIPIMDDILKINTLEIWQVFNIYNIFIVKNKF